MIYSLAVDNFEADVLVVSSDKTYHISSTLVCKNGVQLLADAGNGAAIYLGKDDATSTGKSFPLVAGASIFVPISDLKMMHFIGGGDNLKLWWLAT